MKEKKVTLYFKEFPNGEPIGEAELTGKAAEFILAHDEAWVQVWLIEKLREEIELRKRRETQKKEVEKRKEEKK